MLSNSERLFSSLDGGAICSGAQSSLSVIYATAKENSVTCDCITETSAHPYAVIAETAEKRGCDLITTKVLTHTKIPMLVLR